MTKTTRESIREGISKSGQRVTLSTYQDRDGVEYVLSHPGLRGGTRETPFLDRAEELYELLMRDVTRPEDLQSPNALGPMRKWNSRENSRDKRLAIQRSVEKPIPHTRVIPPKRSQSKRTKRS